MACTGRRAVRETSSLDGAPIVRRRRSRVLGLPAALVVAIAGFDVGRLGANCARCHRAARIPDAAGPADDLHRHGRRNDAAAGCRAAAREDPRARADRDRATSRERRPRPRRLPQQPAERRARQRVAGQPVSARRQLPRVHRFPAARHAAGTLRLHGRRAAEPAVRRGRELGSDPAHRDLVEHAHAGLQSAVRLEHARRRPLDSNEGRPHAPEAPPFKPSTAATCAGRSSSSTAATGHRA